MTGTETGIEWNLFPDGRVLPRKREFSRVRGHHWITSKPTHKWCPTKESQSLKYSILGERLPPKIKKKDINTNIITKLSRGNRCTQIRQIFHNLYKYQEDNAADSETNVISTYISSFNWTLRRNACQMVHMCLKSSAIDAPKQEDWEGQEIWSQGHQAAVNNRNVEVASKQNVKALRMSTL